jgi:GntR family transcriptional regulator
MPAKDEADLLQVPMTLPVLEIVRVGRSAIDDQPWPDEPGSEPGVNA